MGPPTQLQHLGKILQGREASTFRRLHRRPFTSLTERIHHLCTTSNDVDEALRLLDGARLLGHRPNSLNLSSILHALCRSSRFLEAHHRALLAFSSGWLPDDRTSNVLLSLLLRSRTPHLTLRVLRRLSSSKPSFVPSPSVHSLLISQFCAASDPVMGYRLLSDTGQSPSTVSYTAVIDGFARCGHLMSALQLFDEMLKRGVLPNVVTYSALLKGFLRKRMVSEAKALAQQLWVKMVDEEDVTVNNVAFANCIDALCREGYFHEVFRIAEEMPQGRSVCEEFAYAQMIDSLCRSRRHHGASRIVYIMRRRRFIPSLLSYNCIVHNLCKDGEGGCKRAYQLFQEGIEFGYSPPEPTYKVLVDALCRARDLDKARNLTQFMVTKSSADKIRIYNVYISALSALDNPSEQLNVLVEMMLQDKCRPDVITLNTVIHGFCKVGKIDEAREILNDMLSGKFCPPDVITFTTFLSGLLDVGKMEEALDILHVGMQKNGCSPNIATYNAALRGLCKLKQTGKAMEVFRGMAAKGTPSDNTTNTIIISGLLAEGQVTEAKLFWDEVIWPSSKHDDFVYAAILRGLCRLGKLDEACDFLYELVDCGVSPGIVNYNILIDSACKLGLKRLAYQIVSEMRKNGQRPDSVTWRILNKLHGSRSGDLVDCNQKEESKATLEEKKPAMTSTVEGRWRIEEDGNDLSTSVPVCGKDPSESGAGMFSVSAIPDAYGSHMNATKHYVEKDDTNANESHVDCNQEEESKATLEEKKPAMKSTVEGRRRIEENGNDLSTSVPVSGRDPSESGSGMFSDSAIPDAYESHMNATKHYVEKDDTNANESHVVSEYFSKDMKGEEYLDLHEIEPLFQTSRRLFRLL